MVRQIRHEVLCTDQEVPLIIGGIISSVTIPILTSVTAPAKIVQISPAASCAVAAHQFGGPIALVEADIVKDDHVA